MLGTERLNYFRGDDFINLDVKKGLLKTRGGARVVAVNDDFLRGFVAAVEYEAGAATPIILRKCGLIYGQRLAQRFEKELTEFSGKSLRDRTMNEFNFLLNDFWNYSGLGQIIVDWPRAEHGFLAVKLVDSPMQDIGPTGHVADDMFGGVLEGFFSNFTEDELKSIQTGDMRKGDKDGTTFILCAGPTVDRVEKLVNENTRHRDLVEALSS